MLAGGRTIEWYFRQILTCESYLEGLTLISESAGEIG